MMNELTSQVFDFLKTNKPATAILEALKFNFDGASNPNIEDYMSELVDLIAIAERREHRKSNATSITLGGQSYIQQDLLTAYSSIRQAIKDVLSRPTLELTHHRKFVTAVHGALQSGRSDRKAIVNYFTLNYDTLIEDTLALERICYVDGFEGGATAWWRPQIFENMGVESRVVKLHGGIDWQMLGDDQLPRRIQSHFAGVAASDPVLIWPAATKYRETQRDPYAQLIGILRRTLRPAANQDLVLTIAGYSFSDAHINAEIEAALKESNEGLTCLIFTEELEPTGIMRHWLDNPDIQQQIRIYAQGGFFHSNAIQKSSTNLGWWKFEELARLLGGER